MNLNIVISITSGILSYLLLSSFKNDNFINNNLTNKTNNIEIEIESTQKKLNQIINIENKINKINNINILSKFHNSFPIFKKNNLLWYRINITSNTWHKIKVKNVIIKNNIVYVQLFLDNDDDGISDNDSTFELSGNAILNGEYDNLYFQRYLGESKPNFDQNGGSIKLKIKYI
jgi:hypothetical protein